MEGSFAKKTIKGVAWTYLGYIFSKSSGLITTMILARLITPSEFGIIGFAITVMMFMDAVRDMGLGLALIQRRDRVEDAADTVFWLNLLTNFIIWLLMLLIAPLVADFFDEPLMRLILPIMSASFIINSIGSTHDALLQKEMRFAKRVIPAFFSNLLKSAVSISLALLGFGVWSLVFGLLVGRVSYAFITWIIVPWRPRLVIHFDLARELLQFGLKISADSFFSALQANIDYVFIGRFLGDAALGFYTVAFRVPELIIINFCTVIAHVLFPAYATLNDDREKLREAMLGTLHFVSLVTVPIGLGLALVAPLFVAIAFGSEWAQAGPIMAALSLYGTLLAVSWNIGDIYKSIDRLDILWKTALIELALLVPVLYVLAHESALAVAMGHVVVAFIISSLRMGIAIRLLQLSVKNTLAQFVSAVIGGTFMSFIVLVTLQLTANLLLFVSLSLSVFTGVISYLVALWWLERDLLLQVMVIVKSRINLKKSTNSKIVINLD